MGSGCVYLKLDLADLKPHIIFIVLTYFESENSELGQKNAVDMRNFISV